MKASSGHTVIGVDKTCFVTGGTGFIGRNLVRVLLSEGWRVHVIVRRSSNSAQMFGRRSGVSTHVYVGAKELACAMQTANPSVVFHLASLYLREHSPDDVSALLSSNIQFGTQLVEAMRLAETQALVNTGTAWQHFENHLYSPVCLYAATKQAFECILQYYVEVHHLKVISLKLFDTYGPADPRPKLVQLLAKAAETGIPLAMSPGHQRVDMVYVDDVVRAYLRAADLLLSGNVLGHQRYAVRSGHTATLREIVAAFEEVRGVRLNVRWGGRPYHDREVMEPWEGTPLPGWKAEVSLRSGLRRTLGGNRSLGRTSD
jgi:nucleoside-diphosphate-sugar epimerase